MTSHEILGIPESRSLRSYFENLPAKDRERAVSLLVRQAAIDEEFETEIANLYASPHKLHPHVKGALGFFLFCCAAERFAAAANGGDSAKSAERLREANGFLTDSATLDFLFDEYGIDSDKYGRSVLLHRAGAT